MEGAPAAIESLLQNLINLFKDEYPLLRGLDEDAQQLQGTLESIQAYLNDAENKSITEDSVKIWLRELEAAAFDADNALDELSYHLLHKKVYKMKSSKAKVLSRFSSLNRILRGRNMAHTIKQINATFESMNEMAANLGLQSMVVNAVAHIGRDDVTSTETDSFCLDPIFIGRDDDEFVLVDMLTYSPQDRTISVIALVGMGGMGKTTLTRKVFNHERVKAQFGSLIWVHVSQTFDPIILFKKILSALTSNIGDGVQSREHTLRRLQDVLQNKTYLLVLADVWNTDVSVWEDFKNSMSRVTSTMGNGIFITTRSPEVASIVNPFYVHHLSGLTHEDCWSIIKDKAFDENGEVPPGLEIVGRNIAQACRGLPLAANLVGGVLRGKSEYEWHSINEKWLSNAEGYEYVVNIMKLSFEHLSSPSLKKCFAFCSVLPRGQEIEKKKLIELWMLKGVFQPSPRDDMESVGSMFFNVLVQNSLLQVVHRDDHGNVSKCVMHDLVHDLASYASFHITDNSTPVRCMFLGKESSPIPKNVAKLLRTLFLEGGIFDIVFSNFECLHNLTLKGDYKELPYSIRELVHLRNLNISNTEILNLPEWIGELYHLQTLRACCKLENLPSTLKHMFNLRHLHIDSNTKLPAEIGRLTSLQTLPYFKVGKEKGYQIEELGSLKNLKGTLEIHNLETVGGEEEALKENIFENSNLSELVLRWEASKDGERNDEDVLEGLQPLKNANLQKLTISGFQGKRFPVTTWWMNFDRSLTGLIEITLSSCQECEEIPTLGNLPNLKSLSLRKLSNVRSINSSFYWSGNSEGVIFPALESILLLYMVELNEWKIKFYDEVKVFPRLKSLKMYHCYKLECLPDWLFHNTLRLSELDIRHCPKLRELPDGLHALNDLEQMIIRGCRNLKSIANPSGEQSLTSLRSLEIYDCQALTKMVEPSARLLRKVCVVELRSLQNLPEFLDCLVESTLLEQLTIIAVPEVTLSTSSVKMWPFHSLKKLNIDVRQWSKENNEAIKVRVDGILKNCHFSLGELSLTGLEIWECLPHSMQHFTALSSLELKNFGVKALPEWFGGLSSLKRLCLSDYANLRGLPSMQSLTKLQELHIRDCPQLRIVSERHKILNHVLIYVNGHKL